MSNTVNIELGDILSSLTSKEGKIYQEDDKEDPICTTNTKLRPPTNLSPHTAAVQVISFLIAMISTV